MPDPQYPQPPAPNAIQTLGQIFSQPGLGGWLTGGINAVGNAMGAPAAQHYDQLTRERKVDDFIKAGVLDPNLRDYYMGLSLQQWDATEQQINAKLMATPKGSAQWQRIQQGNQQGLYSPVTGQTRMLPPGQTFVQNRPASSGAFPVTKSFNQFLMANSLDLAKFQQLPPETKQAIYRKFQSQLRPMQALQEQLDLLRMQSMRQEMDINNRIMKLTTTPGALGGSVDPADPSAPAPDLTDPSSWGETP